MDPNTRSQRDGSPTRSSPHRRNHSGSSLLSKFPFMRASPEKKRHAENDDETSRPTPRASTMVIQQKTRRRRGSLRKVALLGRGAQRERRDSRPLTIDTSHAASAFSLNATPTEAESMGRDDVLEYKDEDLTPRPSTKRYANPNSIIDFVASSMAAASNPDRDPSGSYTSTDEEDMLQIPNNSGSMRQGLSLPSEAESYFDSLGTTLPRRRSIHQAKSPLSYSGLSASTLPPHDTDWDYADTEWWGWVVLGVTWFVFVIGMGSCFDVWSWAWDVGKTPYAPPELEDDPTLPITGYYPALIILTGIMAWVWVINAWVGMKYFRHAKISGD